MLRVMRTAKGIALIVAGAFFVGCGGSDTSYSDEMVEQHADDTPEATAAAREPMIPVRASTVPYATTEAGETINGYIAAPERPDSVLATRGLDPDTSSLPGLIVIHEWWGLNDNVRTATRRLAGEGFRVLAVDLYRGATADTPDTARELMEVAMKDRSALLANLRAAHTFLREETEAPRVGVLGWCFGGGMALNTALDQPDALDALVIYYGRISDAEPSELEALEMPVLGHFGEADESISLEDVRAFEEMLAGLEQDVQVYTYDEAGHAFANPSGQNYDAEAAAQAWDRTTQFLQRHLYPGATEATAVESE